MKAAAKAGFQPCFFCRRIPSMDENCIAGNAKFQEKGVKASAARARKALSEISRLCKERRKEIPAEKKASED